MGKLDLETQNDDTLTSKPEGNEKIEKDDVSSTKPEESGKPATPSGSLRSILRYSDWKDMVLMSLGTFGCVADGLTMSAMMLVISKLMNAYAVTSLSLADIDKYALALLYVALGIGAGSFLGIWSELSSLYYQGDNLAFLYISNNIVDLVNKIFNQSLHRTVEIALAFHLMNIENCFVELGRQTP